MKTEHTPGPWLILTEPVQGEDCLMVGGGDGSEVVADIRTDWPAGEVEANAHLISSAPEMLAALCALPASIRAILRVKQAIAHAEGREIGMEGDK